MTSILLVVDRLENWPLDLPEVARITARQYLTDPTWAAKRHLRVFNLCKSYSYQSLGYYVSLLAEARSHRPLPSVTTIQDLKTPSLVRFISDDLQERIQKSLAPITSERFVLSIYFGRNLAERYRRLSRDLFNLFPAPLLRASFVRHGSAWQIQGLTPIASSEIPAEHREFVVEAAREYFVKRPSRQAIPTATRYDLAVLVDPREKNSPSDAKALRRFVRAAESLGLGADLIEREDLGHLGEYDGLFIRTTTAVDHYTYRFARRGVAEGLVVIDDPLSILRCSNKVYLAEALTRAGIPTPSTIVVHRENVDTAIEQLGLPAVLKLPDGSFSLSVVKVKTADEFRSRTREFLESSDLVIAQRYLPTDFDWRVGVLDRQILFVCRYNMAKGHWQIAHYDRRGRATYGSVEPVPVEQAPPRVIANALAAANLIGDGLYGVDIKESAGEAYVIEVNDNPNLDGDLEDAILGDDLYRRIAQLFVDRIERLREKGRPV